MAFRFSLMHEIQVFLRKEYAILFLLKFKTKISNAVVLEFYKSSHWTREGPDMYNGWADHLIFK